MSPPVPGAIQVRPAQPADVELIFRWICELAEYENARDQVRGTPELLAEALFGTSPTAEALIAELEGRPAGFAVFHATFSTWECRAGIWLEDLYVPPEHRRDAVGFAWRAGAAITVAFAPHDGPAVPEPPGVEGITSDTVQRRPWLSHIKVAVPP